MILGNKCDMDDKRVISKERGETIARENGVKFLETSAKTNVNIERAFQELSEAILDKFPGAQDNATSAAGALTKSRHFWQTFYSKKIFLKWTRHINSPFFINSRMLRQTQYFLLRQIPTIFDKIGEKIKNLFKSPVFPPK